MFNSICYVLRQTLIKRPKTKEGIQRGGGEEKCFFLLLDYYHIKVIKVCDNASEFTIHSKSLWVYFVSKISIVLFTLLIYLSIWLYLCAFWHNNAEASSFVYAVVVPTLTFLFVLVINWKETVSIWRDGILDNVQLNKKKIEKGLTIAIYSITSDFPLILS